MTRDWSDTVHTLPIHSDGACWSNGNLMKSTGVKHVRSDYFVKRETKRLYVKADGK